MFVLKVMVEVCIFNIEFCDKSLFPPLKKTLQQKINMSCKRKIYFESWEKEFPYLKKMKNDIDGWFIIACNKTFLIDDSGTSQVQSHMASPSHLERGKSSKKQVAFTTFNVLFTKVLLLWINQILYCLQKNKS